MQKSIIEAQLPVRPGQEGYVLDKSSGKAKKVTVTSVHIIVGKERVGCCIFTEQTPSCYDPDEFFTDLSQLRDHIFADIEAEGGRP